MKAIKLTRTLSIYLGGGISELKASEILEVTPIGNSRMVKIETLASPLQSFDIQLYDRWNRSIYSEYSAGHFRWISSPRRILARFLCR